MSLQVVATPIGNPSDISLRAIEILKEADLVIGEERKELSKLLNRLKIESNKPWELLNEHTSKEEIFKLAEVCRHKKVALVSDCGTPGFCDPGAELIQLCRSQNIPVTSVPGASSLMALLSLASQKIPSFLFAGFLPANTEERHISLQSLKNEKRAIVLMDTPYKLHKVLSELKEYFPGRKALLGLDLTSATEVIKEADLSTLAQWSEGKKAEFVLLIYPV